MYDHYCWPGGFWYDLRFDGDDPVIDDTSLKTENTWAKIEEMFNYIVHYHDHYLGNQIMIPMGCDFTFANALLNFRSMDHLIEAFNSRVENITLIYSTPGIYLDTLIAQNISWPTKYDDMFPYADQPEDYWTGYFTSRANAKGFFRDGQGVLHAGSELLAQRIVKGSTTDYERAVYLDAKQTLLEEMGIMQHHDAITGTAKQHVANDYNRRLHAAMEKMRTAYSHVAGIFSPNFNVDAWEWCQRTNGTYLDCPIANRTTNNFTVFAHNPSTVPTDYIKIRTAHGNYDVYEYDMDKQIKLPAEAICHNKFLENGTSIQDCEIFA